MLVLLFPVARLVLSLQVLVLLFQVTLLPLSLARLSLSPPVAPVAFVLVSVEWYWCSVPVEHVDGVV